MSSQDYEPASASTSSAGLGWIGKKWEEMKLEKERKLDQKDERLRVKALSFCKNKISLGAKFESTLRLSGPHSNLYAQKDAFLRYKRENPSKVDALWAEAYRKHLYK